MWTAMHFYIMREEINVRQDVGLGQRSLDEKQYGNAF